MCREDGRGRRVRHADPLGGNVQQIMDVARRELRVAHDEICGPRSVTVLGAVHPYGTPVCPLRKAKRDEVVDRRRPDARSLRRVHPVREVKDVEAADPALGRRPLQTRPSRPPRVGERERRQPPLDVDPVERLLHAALAAHGDRCEGDDLGASLDQAAQAAEHVVGHARTRMRERGHVEGDSHRGARYSKLVK